MPVIHSRASWNARPSTRPLTRVDPSRRTAFLVHYNGGSHVGNDTPTFDQSAMRVLGAQRYHQAYRLWSDIGYNLLVDQAGRVFEGRGWDYQGAHSPAWNTLGYGVQVMVGGDQQPTDAALTSVRWLYDQACTRSGRALAKRVHRDGYPTECPGVPLTGWVHAGMPRPHVPDPPEEDDMPTPADLWRADIIPAPARTNVADNPTWGAATFVHYLGEWVLQTRDQVTALRAEVGALAGALGALAAAQGQLSAGDVQAAAEAGAAAALDARISDADVTLTVTG